MIDRLFFYMVACIKQSDLRNSVMKKYFLLFAIAFGGLFVAGCEAPTVSPDAVSCTKTGGCS